MKILVINGVNLNMLGVRDPEIYGRETLQDLEDKIKAKAYELNITVDCFQSNFEGEIVEKIHEAYGVYDGIIINPGAFTHYSYAIHDAIETVNIPTIEVHISDIHSREEFRHHSVILPACKEQISGLGFEGYMIAMEKLL